MRVLQLNRFYSGSGADRCARELFLQLPAHGIESSMLVGDTGPGTPPGVRAARSALERYLLPLQIAPHLTDWRHFGTIRALREISASAVDVVHVHDLNSGWISIKAVHALCRRMPVVWTQHDEWAVTLGLGYDLRGRVSPSAIKALSRGPIRYLPFDRYHDNFRWRRTRQLLETWLPQPEIVISPSRYIADSASKLDQFSSARVAHVPNGTRMHELAESRMTKAEARRRWNIPADRFVVLMIAADLSAAHKGVPLGIEAVRRLAADADPHLLLLGANANVLARSMNGTPVSCGFANGDPELASAYRAADVTLIPSLGENFPYVALESLACSTPIVCFPVGGLPDITGDNERGLLATRFDAAALGGELQRLAADPALRATLARNGRQWVASTCDMGRYLQTMIELYASAIERFRRRASR